MQQRAEQFLSSLFNLFILEMMNSFSSKLFDPKRMIKDNVLGFWRFLSLGEITSVCLFLC